MWKDLVENANIGENTIRKGLKIVEPRLKEILSGIEHNLPFEKACN